MGGGRQSRGAEVATGRLGKSRRREMCRIYHFWGMDDMMALRAFQIHLVAGKAGSVGRPLDCFFVDRTPHMNR